MAVCSVCHKDCRTACRECGEVHHGGVVILDDNVFSLTCYLEAHPKLAAKMGL